MKNRNDIKWTAVVLAGLGLFALPQLSARADEPANANQTAARDTAKTALAFPPGFTTKTTMPDEGIRTGLAKLAERALTKGDYNKMLEELSRPDRERAREFKGADQAKLDVQIERIRTAWKEKYGKEFAIDEKSAYGTPVEFVEGEVAEPETALANWPVAAIAGEAVTASATVAPGDQKEVKKEAKEQKLEKGRNVALVRFPGMQGHPDFTVSMIHHLPMFWRVDVPNDRTGEEIYNDTLTQLTWLADHSDKWSADPNEAARGFTRHILAAVYGVNLMPPAKG
jgi:hypothetical protein